MECNRDEALRAKGIAESKYAQRDLAGAKKFLNKAMRLHQGLEGLSQLHAVVDVELAAQRKITSTDSDWYDILQTDPDSDEATIKKQYRKLALALHPDKNKFAGAEAAFKLIGEANAILTNKEKRQQFDLRRTLSLKSALRQPGAFNGHVPPGTDVQGSAEPFWTMCPSCRTEFQYLRRYVNHRVECVRCKVSFIATLCPSNQFRWNQHTDANKMPGGSNGSAADKIRPGTGAANASFPAPFVHPAAASAAKEATGTGQKSEDVVQQTFAKVKRERVEAERKAKVLERERRGKDQEELVSKDRMPVEDNSESSKRKKDANLQEKVVLDVKQASMAEHEKKASKSWKRPEEKSSTSRTRSRRTRDISQQLEEDGVEEEEEDEEEDEEEEEEEEDAMEEDADEDFKVEVSSDGEEGEEPPTKLRRSLRKRNNVAYTFGDTDDEKEDDELLNFLAGKNSHLAEKINLPAGSRGGGPNVRSSTVAANGNSSMPDAVRQDTSTKVDGQSKKSEKARSVDGMGNGQRSNGNCKADGVPKTDEVPDQAAGGENSESEWQEYLSKGDQKERHAVNLIHSKEVKDSMTYCQTEPDISRSGVKRKQVVMENVPATTLESSRTKDVTGSMHANFSASSEGGKFGFNIRNMVGDFKEEGEAKSRQLRQRKNVDGNGTLNRSSGGNGRQLEPKSSSGGRVVEKSSPLSAPAPKTTCVTSAGKQSSTALPTTPSSCPPLLSEADIEVPDPDFHVFDNERSETEFAEGQVWAIYDDDDGMPRFYGKIDKVVVSPFKVRMHWLETYNQSARWVNYTKLAIPCGDFKLGKSTDVKAVNIFSHLATVGKGLKNVLKIYPRKQEVWAMYQNWEEEWPTANEEGRKYDMVEVISDFSETEGVNVAPLAKLSEYKSVFRRTPGVVDFYPAKHLLRFSHRVPAYRLAGTEAEGLSRDCWSLDTASMPNDLMNASLGPGHRTMNAAS